ncbi:MAG: hypothetical protein ABFR90_05985 [Planctomycetota bacterium]
MEKQNTVKNKNTSTKRFWLSGLGAISLGVLIGMTILFWYKPRAYKPLQPENPEQVSVYLTDELGPDFFNQVQLDEPFELIIQQAGLNDIISRLDWPQQIGEMDFSDPCIIFSDQSILLMGSLKYKEISSIVSILALPTIDSDGQICLNIQSVHLGMMPVTKLVKTLSQKALDANRDSFEEDPNAEKIVQSIINNAPFDPVFLIPDRQVRVLHFTLEQQVLKLMLLPEKS